MGEFMRVLAETAEHSKQGSFGIFPPRQSQPHGYSRQTHKHVACASPAHAANLWHAVTLRLD